MLQTKVKKGILIFFWLLVLTGCWDRNEISDINFLMGMALDITDEEKLRVTFQWALPKEFSTGGSQSTGSQENTTYSIEADSLGQAMAKLTEISPRTPIYSHMELILIGEGVANHGIKDVITTIDREFEIRRTVNIITAKGKAENLLRSKTPFESNLASGVKNILNVANRSSTYRPVNLNELLVHQSDPDVLAFTPMANMVMNTSLNKTEASGQNAWAQVNKMAFYDQYKLVTELTELDAKAWMYLTGKVGKRSILEIPTEKGNLITSSITQSSKPTIKVNGSSPTVHYRINEEVSIMDSPAEMSISEMEKATANHIKTLTTEMIRKMQEENHDVLFLRRTIREQFPKDWQRIKKNWPEIYAKMNIEVEVDVKIQHENALRKEVPNRISNR
ncbi:Ger(x)C family spore germination protein [Sediminibacillus dalangtanensis]|uniref:Ger(X)C family spore germination protein n=1 Tax=Sediminibacillus dalangtanensis TaxID=2729421 RepID=A0ABX7VPL1_9BACI|nr:Ger(x)C family spore germination protein [Sediminibacillus dalangtanensis]QTM98789.1 Ger(x)C family spore germination protein [Sediminibacillus dalangtanensis]